MSPALSRARPGGWRGGCHVACHQVGTHGHVARMPGHRLPRQTLFVRVRGVRAAGGQQLTARVRLHKLVGRIPAALGAKGLSSLRDEFLSKGWINIAQDRSKWGEVVHAVCGIDGGPAPKNNPKAEYMLEGRPYYTMQHLMTKTDNNCLYCPGRWRPTMTCCCTYCSVV